MRQSDDAEPLEQGWVVLQPKGPRWVFDCGERVGQVVQETNLADENQRLTKGPAWCTIDWENILKSL